MARTLVGGSRLPDEVNVQVPVDQQAPAPRRSGWRDVARSPRNRRLVSLGVWLVAWGVVAGLAVVAAGWALGLTRPNQLVVLQGAIPVIFLAAWVVAVVAVLRRRRLLAVAAGLLVLTHVVAVVPATGSDEVPEWADDAPSFDLFTANVYYLNDRLPELFDEIVEADPDVIALSEVTNPVLRQVEASALADRYEHRFDFDDVMLLSRLPAREIETSGDERSWSLSFLPVRIQVGSVEVTVAAVHATAPGVIRGSAQGWRQELDRVHELASGLPGPVVVAGDFNAGRWHPPFADFLDDGWVDAHEFTGQGLSRSWPAIGRLAVLGPLIRLDHALLHGDVVPLEVTDVDLPGTDHIAFEATIAVRPGTD